MARDVVSFEQRVSDLVFRPEPRDDRPRHDDEPQALREELMKLRAWARRAPRVLPVPPRDDRDRPG